MADQLLRQHVWRQVALHRLSINEHGELESRNQELPEVLPRRRQLQLEPSQLLLMNVQRGVLTTWAPRKKTTDNRQIFVIINPT